MKLYRTPLLCLILMTRAVMAGTSANYTVAPDSIDGGGLRGTSVSYTVNSSVTPGGAGGSPDYAVRTGLAGQLLDAAGLSLAASSLTVSEEGARQLSAALAYDDGTTTVLAADTVTWSVSSGPFTGITTTGLASAAAVYQDTAAVARGSWQSFTATLELTVLNVFPDNFEIYAADGLPDAWQVRYFGVNSPLAAPRSDPDGDTWDNLFEYNACLDPADRFSTFSMSIAEVPGSGYTISFRPRFPDCSYLLMGSDDLIRWAPVSGSISDAGSVRSILDPLGLGGRRFYFIEVLRE